MVLLVTGRVEPGLQVKERVVSEGLEDDCGRLRRERKTGVKIREEA